MTHLKDPFVSSTGTFNGGGTGPCMNTAARAAGGGEGGGHIEGFLVVVWHDDNVRGSEKRACGAPRGVGGGRRLTVRGVVRTGRVVHSCNRRRPRAPARNTVQPRRQESSPGRARNRRP